MKTATLVRALKISALRMQWKQANKFEAEILKRLEKWGWRPKVVRANRRQLAKRP